MFANRLTTAIERTLGELGMARRPPSKDVDEWAHYVTLSPPPVVRARGDQSTSSIYRGIVPAKNIARRDFAINGAVVSSLAFRSTWTTFSGISNVTQCTVHREQWICVRGDRTLDLVLLSRRRLALTLDGRTGAGRKGPQRGLD